jgi:soluble lytic murein transglycosylase
MSPPAASVAARRELARREQARRRRRSAAVRRRRRLKALAGLGLLALLVVAVLPALERTVRDFTLPLGYQDIIREQAAEKHLDPALIAAVIYAETKFDARTSAAGAEGLMQIMPATATYLARRSGATSFTTADLGTPEVNIAYGSYYLRYLLDHYHGNLVEALAAYNGGIANVDRWIAARGRPLSVADIPFPETRAYVERVLQARKDYRRTYPTELGYR